MLILISTFLHFLSQLLIAIAPVCVAYWLNHRK